MIQKKKDGVSQLSSAMKAAEKKRDQNARKQGDAGNMVEIRIVEVEGETVAEMNDEVRSWAQ